MSPHDAADRDVLAGEYVLGLVDPGDLPAVEALVAHDVDFAARVAFWEDRLLPAAAPGLVPAEPSTVLWSRIERDLTAAPAERVVARPGRASPARPPSLARRAWRNTPLWRGVAALATAAALFLAVVPPRSPILEPPPRFFAILQARDAGGSDAGPGWLIQVAADGTVRSVPLGAVAPGAGRSLQLWTLWDGARGPVSLGVLPPGGAVRLPPERLPVIGGGQLFEITLEPEAGSPTGRPTGRILFIGRASSVPAQAL